MFLSFYHKFYYNVCVCVFWVLIIANNKMSSFIQFYLIELSKPITDISKSIRPNQRLLIVVLIRLNRHNFFTRLIWPCVYLLFIDVLSLKLPIKIGIIRTTAMTITSTHHNHHNTNYYKSWKIEHDIYVLKHQEKGNWVI